MNNVARTTERFTLEDLPPNEGRIELTWPGKRPLRSATWHPTLLRESFGLATDGWMDESGELSFRLISVNSALT